MKQTHALHMLIVLCNGLVVHTAVQSSNYDNPWHTSLQGSCSFRDADLRLACSAGHRSEGREVGR